MLKPKVSVLIPVYNGEDTILRCLQSVSSQTYRNLEIIVVNDGSTDKTMDVLKRCREDDERILIIDKENEGLVPTLNLGLERASGEFIARLDADDICFEDRVEKQVQFLLENPTVGLLGTAVKTFGRREATVRYTTNPKELKVRLFFQNDFAHPSVMLRKNVLTSNGLKYDQRFLHVEDFGLWSQIARYVDVANLKEPLLHYQLSPTSVSAKASEKREERDLMHFRIYEENFKSIGMVFSQDELRIHRAISINSPYYFASNKSLNDVTKWLEKIEKHLLEIPRVGKDDVEEVMAKQYFIAFNKFTSLGLSAFLRYLTSRYGRKTQAKNLLKIFLKCLMFYKPKKAVCFERVGSNEGITNNDL